MPALHHIIERLEQIKQDYYGDMLQCRVATASPEVTTLWTAWQKAQSHGLEKRTSKIEDAIQALQNLKLL